MNKESLHLRLQEQNARLISIISSMDDFVFVVNEEGEIIDYYQPVNKHWLGMYPEEFINRNLYDLPIPTEVLESLDIALSRTRKSGQVSSCEYNFDQNWYSAKVTTRHGFEHVPSGYTIVSRDITAQKTAEEQLRILSSTDSLTGLKNRSVFNESIEREINRANRYKSDLSLLMLDLDHFKQVNDNFGHDCGDTVLIEIARILEENIRKTDILCRWGGEEFALIAPATPLENAVYLAENLRSIIDKAPIPGAGHISCSIGVAAYSENDDKKSLLNKADDALYMAKEKGRNCVCKQTS